MSSAQVQAAPSQSAASHSGSPAAPRLRALAAASVAFVVWASCSTAALVELGPVALRPIDVGQVVLVGALLALLRLEGLRGDLRASRGVALGGLALVVAILASAGWVALQEPAARAVAIPSAVRVVQLGVVAVAAALLARSWEGKQQLLRCLMTGALVLSAVYALAHLGITAPVELLALNPGKSAVGPVAVAALVLALTTVEAAAASRLVLAGLAAFNLLFAVSMTAYLCTLLVLPLLVGLLLRLRQQPLRVQVAAVTAVALLCASYAYVGLRVLRPDALPTRISAPLTIEGPSLDTPGRAGSGPGAGSSGVEAEASEGVAGATILHRAILMSTALELFEDAPAAGVGWTRGDDPGIVDRPEVVAEMKRRFPSGYATLFTDISPLGAHNAVFQVLAELGLLGGVPLLAMLVFLVVAATRVTRRRGCTADQVRASAACFALAAVAFGFLMFTGLYPAQVETLLAATAIGAACMLPKRSRSAG